MKENKNLIIFINNKKINYNNFNICDISNEDEKYLFELVF